MALLTSVSQVRFLHRSGKLMGPRLVPMLRVVDGGGEPKSREQRTGNDARGEPVIARAGDDSARGALRGAPVPRRIDPLADVAARAAHGDEAAMRQLLRAIATSLLAAVRAVVGRNAPDVEDIAQETMVAF